MTLRCLFLIGCLAATGYAQAQTQASEPAPATQPSGWEAALKSITEACKGQTPQLCPGLTGETALACLQSNYDKLTPGCKDAVMKLAKSAFTP
jgi:hypothetical protein